MAQFDVYLQWLGIRDPQRPVNHYRLLGLELFEQERDIIAAAADRQMSHVRSYQSGQHADESQSLLNELMAARICLLSPHRKQQYDQQLRAQLAPQPAVARPFPVIISSTPQASAVFTPRKSLTPWIALAVALLVCISLVVAVSEKFAEEKPTPETALNKPVSTSADAKALLVKRSPQQNLPTTNEETKLEAKQELASKSTVPPPTLSSNTKRKVASNTPTNSVPKANETVQKGSSVEKKKPVTNPVPLAANAPAFPMLGQLPQEATPDLNKKSETTTKLAVKPEATDSELANQQANALQIPQPGDVNQQKTSPKALDKADVAAKQKEIRDIFKDEYASRKIEDHLVLAKKLYESAIQQKDDPLTTHVLLTEARDQAVLFGEVEVAMQSCLELGKTSREGLLDDQVSALLKLQSFTGRPPAHYQAVLKHSLELLETLQSADEYDLALKLTNVSLALSKKLNDASAFGQLNARIKEFTILKTLYAKARAARETLKNNPLDADSNQVWGEFLCFAKNDFDAGLVFLAKSADNELKALAQQELSKPTDADKITKLADKWWDLAEKEKDRTRATMRGRALLHYRKVQGQLNGLMAAKVEKRIKEAQADGVDNLGNAKILALMLTAKRLHVKHDFPRPLEDSSVEIKADGKITHHAYETWQVINGEIIMKTKASYSPALIMRLKYAGDHFVAEEYLSNGNLTNKGIAIPLKQ